MNTLQSLYCKLWSYLQGNPDYPGINSSKVYIVNEETKGFETQNIDESEIVLARGNEITFKKIELSRTHIVIEAEIGKVK